MKAYAVFQGLAKSQKRGISNYLTQVHALAPMIRAVRDLENEVAATRKNKEATANPHAIQTVLAFDNYIEHELPEMDEQAAEDLGTLSENLITR